MMSGSLFLYRFACAEFNEASGELRVDGRPVPIEPVPARVLLLLLQHPNEVVTKDELFESVWDNRATVDNVLANAVTKLRKALGAEGAACLRSVPRIGYRLTGRVERVAVGTVAPMPLALKDGMAVPGRPGWSLRRPLGDPPSPRVWLAAHDKLDHLRVFKFATNADGLRALKREYTLYRLLQRELGEHPGFAVVADCNFSESPYFIECAYGGEDLHAWSAGARLAELPREERLALFGQIARAVADAHSVGVLHKDIKPGNVLVNREGGRWHARLTDFGSARALDPGRLQAIGLTAMGLTVTQAVHPGALSGTPLYLAPELLAGHPPTTRSDVYALGILLCQLMAGDLRRPMASGWQRAVGDELIAEDIALATEGDPELRLDSAAALADRILRVEERRAQRRRELAAANQAAMLERQLLRSHARRPWVVLALSALAMGLAAALWSWQQARLALQMARAEQQRAEAIGEFLHRDVLESPDILTVGTVRPQNLLEVLQRASRNASARFTNQPVAEAVMRRRLAETYLRMASLVDARKELERAAELLDRQRDAPSTELLMVQFLQARLLVWAERPAQARAVLEAAEARVVVPAPDELTYHRLRARYELLLAEKQFPLALPVAEQLVAAADAAYGHSPHLRADARQRMAEVHWRLGDKARVDAIFATIAAPPYNSPSMAAEFHARQHIVRAQELAAANAHAQALPLLTAAHDRLMAERQPNEYYLAFIELETGLAHYALGGHAVARDWLQRAKTHFVKVVGPGHQYAMVVDMHLAYVCLAIGSPDTALELIDGVERWREQHARPIWKPLINLARASALNRLGRPAEALPLLQATSGEDFKPFSKRRDWQAVLDAEAALSAIALGQVAEGRLSLQRAMHDMKGGNAWPWLIAHYGQARPARLQS